VSIRHSSYFQVVARLGTADLEAALRFVREAHAEAGADPFPAHMVELLRLLVGSEQAAFCEEDRVHKRLRWYQATCEDGRLFSGDGEDEPAEWETFWRLESEHPLCQAHRVRFDAMRISDFLTARQWHRTAVYNDYYLAYLDGMEYEIEVGIPSHLDHTKTFFFLSAHRDFGERDRALLNLLAPHLAQLYEAATVRRAVALDLVDRHASDPDTRRGIVLPDRSGREIEAASDHARRLLETYFPDARGIRLPTAVSDFLEQARARNNSPRLEDQHPPELEVSGPAGMLTIERTRAGETEVIVLEEQPISPGKQLLTARERQVLDLVAEGMHNSEIAQDLWVSPSTVRKHLENIYEKLEVSTRTAAVHAYNHRYDRLGRLSDAAPAASTSRVVPDLSSRPRRHSGG
jgi:DNA-binding CsgD family transcriptional regulator